MKTMPLQRSLGAGLAGGVALTLMNAVGHRLASESPRLDVLGTRALVRGLRAAGRQPPEGKVVPVTALLGDLVTSSLYYGLAVGRRRDRAFTRGLLAGLAAGIAAVLISPLLGMNSRTGYHWGRRLTMIGLYTAGGAATAAAAHAL